MLFACDSHCDRRRSTWRIRRAITYPSCLVMTVIITPKITCPTSCRDAGEVPLPITSTSFFFSEREFRAASRGGRKRSLGCWTSLPGPGSDPGTWCYVPSSSLSPSLKLSFQRLGWDLRIFFKTEKLIFYSLFLSSKAIHIYRSEAQILQSVKSIGWYDLK